MGALISSAGPVNTMTTPFDYVELPVVLDVTISGPSGMLASIPAELGVQGSSTFLFSLTSNIITSYLPTCLNCLGSPFYASPYFNAQSGQTTVVEFDGYSQYGTLFNRTLCLYPQSAPLTGIFCTADNTPFYGISNITYDNWNYGADGFHGVIGFGPNSAIWPLIDPLIATKGYYYEVVLASATGSSTITMNTGLPAAATGPAITAYPNSATQVYNLYHMGFGVADFAANTTSFMSILKDVPSNVTYITSATIAADMRGIALPPFAYFKFTNLLSIATNGAVVCPQTVGGFCVLSTPCQNYQSLNSYSFNISLSNDTNYLLLPLSALMADNQGTCEIYAQYLDPMQPNATSVVLGVGFLQQFTYTQANSNVTTLTVNPNALSSAFIGSEQLTKAATSIFQIQPVQATVFETASNMPALVESSYDSTGTQTYYMLDFTNSQTVMWPTFVCTQNVTGSAVACSAPPTYLTGNYVMGSNQQQYSNVDFGGYQTSGFVATAEVNQCLSWNLTMCQSPVFTEVYQATEVYTDAWLSNFAVNETGILGYGPESAFWYQYIDPMTDSSTYAIALSSNTSVSNITLGAGSTSGFESAASLNLQTQTGIEYAIETFGFGLVYYSNGVYTSSYFQNFTNVTNNVVSTLNYIGLGLPQPLYEQFTALLSNVTNEQPNCTDYCTFQGYCTQNGLVAYSFQMTFSGSTNYINVPLTTFMVQEQDSCSVYVQNLATGQPQTSNIILGSMFFRNFYGIFQNNYAILDGVTSMSQSLSFYVNVQNQFAYIGNEVLPIGKNPFTAVKSYKLSLYSAPPGVGIYAFFGPERALVYDAGFAVSFVSDQIMSFAYNCLTDLQGNGYETACNSWPTSVNDFYYPYSLPGDLYQTTIDGYTVQGYQANNQLCFPTYVFSNACTPNNVTLTAVTYINQDNWNFELYTYQAGIIGIQIQSPIWSAFGIDTNLPVYYSVQLQNETDWSFINASAPVIPNYYLTLSDGSTLSTNTTTTTVTATSLNTFNLTEFSFGVIDSTAGTISSQSILNSNETLYQQNTNQSIFTLDFSGIGLPELSYNIFTNLMSIATKGQVQCIKKTGGYCYAPTTCANLAPLWDYSFYVGFNSGNTTQYITVPLASFAMNKPQLDSQPTCAIYVQYLNSTWPNSTQIVFGQMFFQSFVAEFMQSLNKATQMTLQVNLNAPPGTAIFNEPLIASSSDAFIVEPAASLPLISNSFPSINLTVTNMASQGYYMLDFSNDNTVMWSFQCRNYVPSSSSYGQLCTQQPLMLASQYYLYGPRYYDMNFGGYLTNGTVGFGTVCLNQCIEMLIYSADYVMQDNWLYNQGTNGQYLSWGIIGLGPNSPLWNSFISPTTGLVSYSIQLDKADPTQSSIVLGQQSLTAAGNASVSLSTGSSAIYDLSSFGFGTVYYTGSVASSSYFSNMTLAPVQFSVNFQGIGLPQNIFNQWQVLLKDLTGVSCSFVNGACQLPNFCSFYNFEDFSFQMIFTSALNYMQVPISTFAVTQGTNCYLYVNSISGVQSQNIILGYMYFQEFAASFTNQYSQSAGMIGQTGTVTLQATAPSSAYIGNRLLATGVNPFVPATRTISVGGIIVLIIVAGLLIVFTGYNIFKYCTKPSESSEASALVYERNSSTSEPLNIANNAVSLNKYDDEQ